jgi:hypothetical protein
LIGSINIGLNGKYAISAANLIDLNTKILIIAQMLMFINKETKKMTLDKEKIFRDAVRVYSPN